MIAWNTRHNSRLILAHILLQIVAVSNISSFFVIQHVNRSANLAAHLRANRACCTLNVDESWLDETPRFLLLFCGVPHFLVTSVLANRPKDAYI